MVNLTIRDCGISGWGGQGIDMVGCHDSLVSGCRFVGKPNFTATAGVQTKGGCSDIMIEKCHFIQAGERPMNIGGSTDWRLFRPASAKFEARRIAVRDNTIEGSSCAAAFVGVDGAEFIGNTILYPEKRIFRVLQETTAEDFLYHAGSVPRIIVITPPKSPPHWRRWSAPACVPGR
ncbi:MAG: right-handed parallel beta-helix repeat-containing protein [Planctomycetes bacterium]|nr:right-handed parallel beta-helix repeat-containing protein [Planctomycetota bacterium]